MKWTQRDPYYLEADGYTVSKARVMDLFRYTAWRRESESGKRRLPTLLGCFDSSAEAKLCCEQDQASR